MAAEESQTPTPPSAATTRCGDGTHLGDDNKRNNHHNHQAPDAEPMHAGDAIRGPVLGAGLVIIDIDKRRGRGVLATREHAAGDPLLVARPDIVVLYTDFAGSRCAHCLRSVKAIADAGEAFDKCQHCDLFVLCSRCSPDDNHDTSPGWRAHKQPCDWFMTLPEATRRGDTDYVRFLLEYSARAQRGDVDLIEHMLDCCALEDAHAEDTKRFAQQYAAITVNQFAKHGLLLPLETLRQVLLRVKANALGFPCDSANIYGWAMHGDVCALNHSCVPNAEVVQDDAGNMVVRALQSISPGEEVLISYVQVDNFRDPKARRRFLLEKYRFLCMCPMCSGLTPSSTLSPSRRSEASMDGTEASLH